MKVQSSELFIIIELSLIESRSFHKAIKVAICVKLISFLYISIE